MFKWLADMIMKTPVQGTCACCEGKKERLRQMQKAILDDENGSESGKSDAGQCESCDCGGSCGGDCHCQKGQNEPEKGACSYDGLTFSSTGLRASYRFNAETHQFDRSVKYEGDESQKSEE